MRTHFVSELEAVRKDLVEMGEAVVSLFGEALHAVVGPNSGALERASELEARTDRQHRSIRDQCLNLITLQAPVAGDARLITGILDAIVDLELIGDYAYEVVTIAAPINRKQPSQISGQIAEVGGRIRELLSMAIDGWRSGDHAPAPSMRACETPIRAECKTLCSKLSQLVASAGKDTAYVDLMLICNNLERILRHAVCVADEAAEAAPLTRAA